MFFRLVLIPGLVLTLGGTACAQDWTLTGNTGTNPATNFLGTQDSIAFEIRVDKRRALRIEPASTSVFGFSPNLIGGFEGNSVTAGVAGATISGGGASVKDETYINRVTDDFGTVGGGLHNQAGDAAGTTSDRRAATVCGGTRNTASGFASTVGGGALNTAQGAYSFAAGYRARANHTGSFVWADATEAVTSTVDNQFLVHASGGAFFLRGVSASPSTYAALQAVHGTSAGEAAWLQQAGFNNPFPVMKLLRTPFPSHIPDTLKRSYNFVEGFTAAPGVPEKRKFYINRNGSFVGGSDFAESLPAKGGEAAYEPGEVLVLSADLPGAVEKAHHPYDVRVAGVYSTRPGIVGADKDGETRLDPDDIPVAIVGIVPTKVTTENGPIQAGDLLTTSNTTGHAMKASPVKVNGIELYPTGAILGKALEPLEKGEGSIKVLVMLR